MKRLLPVYITFLVLTLFGIYSCGKSDSNTSDIMIVGMWQLKQEFSNEEENAPLEEFPLTSCEKMTTLEVLLNGRFIEKNYYDDFGTGGECIKDTEDTRGNWKKESDGTFYFIYDKSEILLFNKSYVTIKNGNLVVTIEYDDPDLGYETTLKFVYAKKH
ncbi:hypothetical protein ATE84_0956 [Aquimarina sp. MAR_2010_214]|uniref:hypothetical protein n=1 Tax=Aquimarina sp. MAR_2010_214 TaxID=1250026 RepID=UPI000CA8092B|nr:hypothetical protein [Aquimarina sp. MAR_2010_214]PKV48940.1 hypothetical protein ATE84_0956 [Aquimarina sp. MAR_2010_214]